MKAKVLDLAIKGKLVPQDPNDESADVLLEKIREEKEKLIKEGKLKRDKNETYIFKNSDDNSYYEQIDGEKVCIDDDLPFEIPDSWRWTKFANICEIARGGSPRPIEAFLTNDENGINWIKIGDTEKGGKYIYSTKDPVELDLEQTEAIVEKVIADDYVTVKNNLLRHNVLKLGMHIFGYLLEQERE